MTTPVAADYRCRECQAPAVTDGGTVHVEHKLRCPVRKHLLRVRAAAKARA